MPIEKKTRGGVSYSAVLLAWRQLRKDVRVNNRGNDGKQHYRWSVPNQDGTGGDNPSWISEQQATRTLIIHRTSWYTRGASRRCYNCDQLNFTPEHMARCPARSAKDVHS